MKRSLYSLSIIFALCLSIAACSGSGQSTHSSITILIGASHAASASINSVTFTVTGPGMEEMKTVLTNISTGQPVSTTLFVLNGQDRIFDVAVRDDLQDVIYRGSKSGITLDGKPTSIDIELQPSTRQFGAATNDESYGIATDKAGNAYVIGTVYSTMTTMFSSDVVLTKFDSSGSQQWQRQFGASNTFNEGYGVALDTDGNVYITGSTNGVVGADPSAGGTDCFIAKYDSSGNQLWMHQFGSTGSDFSSGIAVDNTGTAFVTGTTDGTIDGQTNAGGYDAFIVKFDSAGTRAAVQTRLLGTAQNDSSEAITMDASGNIIIAGYTGGTLAGTTNTGLYDLFVAKYDQSVTQLWISQRGSIDDDQAWDLAVDSSGNVFVAGGTYNGLDGFANPDSTGFTSDLFIVKYSASGAWQWTRQAGTSDNDSANGIATDSAGNIYATGGTAGGFDGNTSSGGYDLLIVKYNANGEKQWTRQRGTSSDDEGMAIAAGSNGNVLVTGYTVGDLDKNINKDNDPLVETSDCFVMEFDPTGQKQ